MPEYELLADGMRLDGVEKVKGDKITLTKERGDQLAALDQVKPVETKAKGKA